MVDRQYNACENIDKQDEKFVPIITSLLDTDLYKLNMLRVFVNRFANINATYEFKDRTGAFFTTDMICEIQKQISHLCTLRFTEDEIAYIANIYYHKEAKFFHEFLRLFKLNREYIKVVRGEMDGELSIVAKGPIWAVSMFEIYVLAIVNEVYFKYITNEHTIEWNNDRKSRGMQLLKQGLASVQNIKEEFNFTDFGTRRRFSLSWQKYVIEQCLSAYHNNKGFNTRFRFVGTSNVMLAREFGITPIGTMAHEYIQLGQALDNVTLSHSQKYMLQAWADEYRGDLGTALSDTLTTDYFLQHDFDKYFSKLFDGVRHDSGCPYKFADKMYHHYRKMGIDPMTKTIIYSDGLDFNSATEIAKYCEGKIKVAFGIGTKLTNNFAEFSEALNIVFKMVTANEKPVAKLSDADGKCMCKDENYLAYLRGIVAVN